MSDYDKYYSILGLKPGAGADEVKKAFRARIKEAHPDRSKSSAESDKARELIEAYKALKDGPPAQPAGGARRGPRPDPTSRGAYDRQAKPGPGGAARGFYGASSEFAAGREAGRRIFENLFRDGRFTDTRKERDEDDYWDIFSDLVYDDGEESVYGKNVGTREYPGMGGRGRGPAAGRRKPEPSRARPGDEFAGRNDPGSQYFNRAETALREVVGKYDRAGNLKRKGWVREYLAQLNNVLVLFRDVASRHAMHAPRALQRVRQIRELSAELRRMLAS